MNRILEKLLKIYKNNYPKTTDINYILFKVITIAFLKENNEELVSLCENNEIRIELFMFINQILKEDKEEIKSIINIINTY
jgi:hypothetical protein